jgi:hypothetical protein
MDLVLPAADIELGRLRAFGVKMRVWWAKDRLTRELARGAASVDSRELALRAGQLTAVRTRDVVASSIDDLLEQANRPQPQISAQVPIDYGKVRAAGDELAELAERLRAPRPIRAEGVALALLLLTDVEQPLFGLGTAEDLASAIIHATQRLEP